MKQHYELKENVSSTNILKAPELEAVKDVVSEWFELIKPADLKVKKVSAGEVWLEVTCLCSEQEDILIENKFEEAVEYTAAIKATGRDPCSWEECPLKKTGASFSFVPGFLEAESEHSEWSEETVFAPRFAEFCAWKKCPNYVDEKNKYFVDELSPMTTTKTKDDYNDLPLCTVIGNTPLPQNKVTSWSIKILKSMNNDGSLIYIGIAPFDIDQSKGDNCEKCGWYFDCYDSTLHSGPPHNYNGKEYGPRKGDGEYICIGDSVGVVMDTAKGELSFVVNGVNLGVACDGIPLDKPLVPCVLLGG